MTAPPWLQATLDLLRDIDAERAAQYGDLDSDRLVMAMAAEAKRVGRADEGLATALLAHTAQDSYFTAAAVATLYRALGDLASAEPYWRRATEHRPDDIGVRLDWADALVDHAQPELALPLYDQVLRVQMAHPWAEPSSMYCRWAAKPTLQGRLDLAGYARSQPDNHRAAALAARATPYVGWIPAPRETCINGLHRIREPLLQAASDGDGTFAMTLSALEAPSALWACTAEVWRHGAELTITVEEVQQPDPRQPRWSPSTPLWEWQGTTPQPALNAPPSAAADALASVARTPFDRGAWFRAGSPLVGVYGAEALLATALHAPPGPPGYPSWLWLQRVQLAAALALAADPDPWQGGPSKPALHSLLAVRNDWLTAAGIVAATQRAQVDPAAAIEVREWLAQILADAPTDANWHPAQALYGVLLELGVEGEARRALMNALEAIEEL